LDLFLVVIVTFLLICWTACLVAGLAMPWRR
jgi:hypothetical protein